MEEEEGTSSPFWLKNTATGNSRRLSRSYSMFFNSGAVLIFILVAALALMLIIAPTLHSFTSHILKPQSVKKSWDSLNLVLVLFAILCGFLSRNTNTNTNETPRLYENQNFTETPQDYKNQSSETQMHWYDYSDRTTEEYYRPYNRLRSISSYPDLRQDSPWIDEPWRFYDDTLVNRYRQHHRHEEEEAIVKNIKVDTFEVRTKKVPSAPPVPVETKRSPPSPPPPPPPTRRKDHPKNVGTIEKQRNEDLGGEALKPQQSMPPPPPPPPPPATKSKRGSATKEFLTSLKGKKKRQRQRSVENFESMLMNSKPPSTTLLPRQPPPPPPPPPSVFHSLFSSKKSKRKKGPYDPRHSPHVSSSKSKPHVVANADIKPRLRENFYSLQDNVVTGNESPLIPIPPPPPPPPFKLPAWKFRVQGDYVRVDSISSSSSERSPDLDEVEDSQTSEAARNGGIEPEIMLFYPSPDVNTKADTFIEKFRAGLRMEKMNSTRVKQGIGMSNLGPSPYLQKTGSNKLKIYN